MQSKNMKSKNISTNKFKASKHVSDDDFLSGVELIKRERVRQVSTEGWTQKHDDNHDMGELLHAAQSYVMIADAQTNKVALPTCFVPKFWPWELKWFKPSRDQVQNLVKAGALIAAEIDRIKRIESRTK